MALPDEKLECLMENPNGVGGIRGLPRRSAYVMLATRLEKRRGLTLPQVSMVQKKRSL